MSIRIALLLLFLAPSTALAGDPCPIRFDFHDLEVPHWLDRTEVLEGLKSKESWVGISFADTTVGVKLLHVYDESPAAKIGLQRGDVITRVGGSSLETQRQLSALLRATPPGVPLALQYLRDGQSRDAQLTLGYQDPVLDALIEFAARQKCSKATRAKLTTARRATLVGAMVSKQRRFQCDTAHRALSKLGLYGGDLVFVRGSRRVLIANPGWGSVCIKAKDYDGEALTEKAIAALFDSLTARFVKDRHDNP